MSVQLTKEAKKCNLDVIVWACVVAVIGLLNIYTDEDLEYSWTKASEVVAKTQRAGVNHAQCIWKWAIGFLKRGDLPLYQLNWKWATIIDDEDIAEELKMCMMEKGKEGFLKAQDIVDIIASPKMQEIFTQKNISKQSISIKMALHVTNLFVTGARDHENAHDHENARDQVAPTSHMIVRTHVIKWLRPVT
jgi:hypothetical protein